MRCLATGAACSRVCELLAHAGLVIGVMLTRSLPLSSSHFDHKRPFGADLFPGLLRTRSLSVQQADSFLSRGQMTETWAAGRPRGAANECSYLRLADFLRRLAADCFDPADPFDPVDLRLGAAPWRGW
jgi:hypothetical protein